jgi:hypothetical protein
MYDEVRMYDYPMAQTEIFFSLDRSVLPSNYYLKAYYRMDETDGITIHDMTLNAHDGLLYNNPVFNIPSTAPINNYSSYLWSTGETTSSITGQVGTSYSVTVTNVHGCSMTSDPVVADNPNLNPAAIPSPEIFSSNFTPCTPGMVTLSTVGNSLPMNGTDQYAELGNWFNYQNFTIEMWLKPGATQLPYTDIIENNHYYGGNWVLQQWPGNTNTYYFYICGESTTGIQLTADVWQHLALVKSPSKMEAYINGVLVASHNLPSNFVINYINPELRLSRLGPYSDRFWNGVFDEVRMFDTPLSQSQILQSMDYSIPASANHLVAYYRMDEASGNTIHDLTSNGRDGTLFNGPQFNVPSTCPINNYSSYSWSTSESTSSIGAQVGDTFSVTVTNSLGCSMTSQVVTAESAGPCGANVQMHAYIQGFYLGGGLMQPVLYTAGISQNATDCDSVTIELYSDPNLALVRRDKVLIKTDGTISYDISPTSEFPTVISGGSYYIVLRSRNALETWSASPVLFSDHTVYDFATSATQSFGPNEVDLGDGSFALWSGDVNQDGAIESSDFNAIENASLLFRTGYYPEDITGDNLVESCDYSLIENNHQLLIFAITP